MLAVQLGILPIDLDASNQLVRVITLDAGVRWAKHGGLVSDVVERIATRPGERRKLTLRSEIDRLHAGQGRMRDTVVRKGTERHWNYSPKGGHAVRPDRRRPG